MRGVRNSFDRHPVKSTAAAAVFGGAFYWALKSAQKSGPIGAALKGFVALAVMKQAKNSLMSVRPA